METKRSPKAKRQEKGRPSAAKIPAYSSNPPIQVTVSSLSIDHDLLGFKREFHEREQHNLLHSEWLYPSWAGVPHYSCMRTATVELARRGEHGELSGAIFAIPPEASWPPTERGTLMDPSDFALCVLDSAGLIKKRRHEPFSQKVKDQGKSENVYFVVVKSAAGLEHETSPSQRPTHDIAVALFDRVRTLIGDQPAMSAPVALADQETRIDEWLRAAAKVLAQKDAATTDPAEWPAPPAADPLQAARDRGRHYALAELEKAENLSLRDASTYSGRSDRAINEARLKGQLYALVPPGKQRGLRYPMWQFDAQPDRLAAVLEPFVQASASCWVVHNFMQRPLEVLDGLSPKDWALDVSKPIEAVILAATNRFVADQGAA